jgi:hypothetical protein
MSIENSDRRAERRVNRGDSAIWVNLHPAKISRLPNALTDLILECDDIVVTKEGVRF